METAGIAALLKPFVPAGALCKKDLAAISIYVDILLRWNTRMSLTAVRDPEQMVRRHFGEALFAAHHLFPQSDRQAGLSFIDVGSGAGFPGLPMKIWAPNIHATLIEAHGRKATFLREVIRALKLTSVDVFAGRAEDCGLRADLVTLRAVENFETILPIAAGLVRVSRDHRKPGDESGDRVVPTASSRVEVCPGRLALLIGLAQVPRAMKVLSAAAWRWGESVPIPESTARVLLVGWRSPAGQG